MSDYYLFTDGGVVRKNPSPIGGSWAWRLVKSTLPVGVSGINHPGKVLLFGSGMVEPAHVYGEGNIAAVSNNQTELMAICWGVGRIASLVTKGIVEHPGRLRICSDSQVAIGWWQGGYRPWSIPEPLLELRERAFRNAREARIGLDYELLAGHPNKVELAQGWRDKPTVNPGIVNTYPVSLHNVWCDKECTRLCKAMAEASHGK